jgi:hypothetical protein
MIFGMALRQSAAVVAVISEMITPAIFILATGNLINGSLTRVARIVDRARQQIERANELKDTDPQGFHEILNELQLYKKRSSVAEFALSAYFSAIGLFVAACLSVALDVFSGGRLPWLATALTIVGASAMFAGSIANLIEVRLATGTLRREIDREIRLG